MDCNELLQSTGLIKALASESEISDDELYRCFEKLFLETSMKCARVRFFRKSSLSRDDKMAIFKTAFAKTFEKFVEYFRKKEFKEQGAKVKSVFIFFFKRILSRTAAKFVTKNTINAEIDKLPLASPELPDKEEERKKAFILHQVLGMLDEKDRELIYLRKGQGLGIPEVARLFGMKEDSAKNAIYRSWKEFKSLGKAFRMLSDGCQKLVGFRKAEKLEYEEISRLLAIPENIAKRETDKCCEKFNEIKKGLEE